MTATMDARVRVALPAPELPPLAHPLVRLWHDLPVLIEDKEAYNGVGGYGASESFVATVLIPLLIGLTLLGSVVIHLLS